jgi:hypothetical protein
MKKRPSKTDLAAEVLKRIRAREGCQGVSKVVLEEIFDEHPDCNGRSWSSTPLTLPIP